MEVASEFERFLAAGVGGELGSTGERERTGAARVARLRLPVNLSVAESYTFSVVQPQQQQPQQAIGFGGTGDIAAGRGRRRPLWPRSSPPPTRRRSAQATVQ